MNLGVTGRDSVGLTDICGQLTVFIHGAGNQTQGFLPTRQMLYQGATERTLQSADF